jgi:anti-sigma regulatory factor (Ser/Thr protein kinase)
VQLDFDNRLNAGDIPDAADYVSQFPELASEARLLDTLALTKMPIAHSSATPPVKSGDADTIKPEEARASTAAAPQPENWLSIRPGMTLGNYSIIDCIGQGGMGAVFKAEHVRMKRVVALKTISPAALNSGDAVQRFHRETGIAARFLIEADEISLPAPVCRELARIVQEALVNVRKHSGAKQVMVQFVEADGKWELIVEDDGAGFPFAGKISQAELDSSGRVPAIIRERVRLIQGELTIESKPGGGARLEILVPQAELVS